MSSNLAGDLEQLTAAACDGTLSAEGVGLLESLLQGSEQAQQYFLDYFRLDAELADHWQSERSRSVLEQVERAFLVDDRVTWRERAWDFIAHNMTLSLIVSGLTITTVLLSLALWHVPDWKPASPRDGTPSTEFVARISNTSEATFDKTSQGNLKNRDLFDDEKIVLNSGLAVIEYSTGARVVLEGPATYHLAGANGGDLRWGRLLARVDTEESRGFSLAIPSARIVDLGTEFGVEVDANGLSDVAVLSGKIELAADSDSPAPRRAIRLAAGEAASVAASDGQITRHNQVDARFARALRGLADKLQQDVGQEPQRGMAGNGAIVYIDASPANTIGDTFKTSGSAATGNAGWHIRTGFGNGDNVFAAADANDPSSGESTSELTTIIRGLTAGRTYDLYVYFWAVGRGQSHEDWDIEAGLVFGSLTAYSNVFGGAIDVSGITPSTYFANDRHVVVVEGNRKLYEAYLGTAVANGSGEISVFINDHTGNDDRTWYDGVGYKLASSSDPTAGNERKKPKSKIDK